MFNNGFGRDFFNTMYSDFFKQNEEKWKSLENEHPYKLFADARGSGPVYNVYRIPLLKFADIPAGVYDGRLYINADDEEDYRFDCDYMGCLTFNINRKYFFTHFARNVKPKWGHFSTTFNLDTAFEKDIYNDLMKRIKFYFIRDFFVHYLEIPASVTWSEDYSYREYIHGISGAMDKLEVDFSFDLARGCIGEKNNSDRDDFSPLYKYPKYAEAIKSFSTQIRYKKDETCNLLNINVSE